MFKPWFCFSFLAIHPKALLSAPSPNCIELTSTTNSSMFKPRFCFVHAIYIQKIFSLPHCRIFAGFPKGRQGFHCDAILVQRFQWAALQYLYRGPTDVQGFHSDALFVQKLQLAALQYLCRGPAYVQGFQWAAVPLWCNICSGVPIGSFAILVPGSNWCAGVPMGSPGSHAGLCVLASKLLPADLFLSPSLEPALKLGDKHRK